MRVLEVGCAEGELGTRLKNQIPITYWGIEPSLDAIIAKEKLEAVYSDSRALPDNTQVFDDMCQRQRLLDRFLLRINGDFAVYGLGEDFCSYVEPLIDQLSVKALIDSDQQRTGQPLHGLKDEKYSSTKHHDLHIFVWSILHEKSIVADLQKAGHPLKRIILLSDIYNS